MSLKERIIQIGKQARGASYRLAVLTEKDKNKALLAIAGSIESNRDSILKANRKDVDEWGQKIGTALTDRLTLNEKRISGMIKNLKDVASLRDPVGEVVERFVLKNGLEIKKVRVPLGVIGFIYEARPNVTIEAVSLCIKAGNAVILRGGKEALNSNKEIVRIINSSQNTLPEGSVQLIEDMTHESSQILMGMREYVDVLIPRGGEGLIKSVVENAKVPVIETGIGNCHVFVDESADLEMAKKITMNAKCQRPSVCNAAEKLLVHEKIAGKFLPEIAREFSKLDVEMRGDEKTRKIIDAKKAGEEDWYTEYLSLIIGIKVVKDVNEAIDHINKYGSKHSDSIITRNRENAQMFVKGVDSAAVYVNASTRLTDGSVFGMGGEVGISTQKLHARGPVGLRELTTTKFIGIGNGQIRE
ncbi:glutamate-5-semialdehyde dehydrogenase [Candidatus Micrarchaeota archaeon]|nr:glutamate-5-semialdehyde dehydrogenase [Candidatus Micrarchaeota archaeon]